MSGLSWKVVSPKTTDFCTLQPTGKVSPTTAHCGGERQASPRGGPWYPGLPPPRNACGVRPRGVGRCRWVPAHLGLPKQRQDLPQVVQQPHEVEPVWGRAGLSPPPQDVAPWGAACRQGGGHQPYLCRGGPGGCPRRFGTRGRSWGSPRRGRTHPPAGPAAPAPPWRSSCAGSSSRTGRSGDTVGRWGGDGPQTPRDPPRGKRGPPRQAGTGLRVDPMGVSHLLLHKVDGLVGVHQQVGVVDAVQQLPLLQRGGRLGGGAGDPPSVPPGSSGLSRQQGETPGAPARTPGHPPTSLGVPVRPTGGVTCAAPLTL